MGRKASRHTTAGALLAANVPRALDRSAVEHGVNGRATTARLNVLSGVDTLVVGAKTEETTDRARLKTGRAEGRCALLLVALAVVTARLRPGGLAALVLPVVSGRARRRGRRGQTGDTAALLWMPPPSGRARRAGRRRRRVGLATVRNAALALETEPPMSK